MLERAKSEVGQDVDGEYKLDRTRAGNRLRAPRTHMILNTGR